MSRGYGGRIIMGGNDKNSKKKLEITLNNSSK
jgi:hypothetical protein